MPLLEHSALVLAFHCHEKAVRVSSLPLSGALLRLVVSAERAVRGERAEQWPLRDSIVKWAAAHGGASALTWALARQPVVGKWEEDLLCIHAGWSGDESTVRVVVARYGLRKKLCDGAAAGGRIALIQWLERQGCPFDVGTCALAAAEGGGSVESLQHLRQRGCPWDEQTCSAAAAAGHVNVLRWAHENGCEWGESTCVAAAIGGSLEALQYARQQGCPWDDDTCDEAAATGHLEILRWARENGGTWSHWACDWAAGEGHLDTLQYAVENGCPWSPEECLRNAERGGHADIAAWVEAKRALERADTSTQAPAPCETGLLAL